MTDGQNMDTEAYLARIRRTIAESERLVESARLRVAETDRMLEKQGLTREQVMNFRFSPEQREAVNRELVRQGMAPIEENEPLSVAEMGQELGGAPDFSPLTAVAPDAELENRQRKFGMMMKPFQI